MITVFLIQGFARAGPKRQNIYQKRIGKIEHKKGAGCKKMIYTRKGGLRIIDLKCIKLKDYYDK